MRIHAQYDNLDIPGYALSYLINGDNSGLDNSDIREIDAYMEEYYQEAKKVKGNVNIECDSEEGYFTWNPEFGLACECYECTIAILV